MPRIDTGDSSTRPTRVGIVTINDDSNFGNRLQSYALQRAVQTLGFDTELVRNTPPPMRRRLLLSRTLHAIRNDGPFVFMRRNVGRLVDRTRQAAVSPAPFASLRREAIAEFAHDHLAVSPAAYSDLPSTEWSHRYGPVIVGSDQVWNHGFRNADEIDFLTFAARERRIAYAASFGVHDVPTFLRRRYRDWLSDIPHLSVREQRGAEIVHELTGRTVPVVVDPTMLLTRDDWQSLLELPPALKDGPYAAQFFLGHADTAQVEWTRRLAERRGVLLVDLNDLRSDRFADVGPGGFVAALAQASFVATDSFHATVFALLHHTPVVVRSRDETDSRLHTLLDKHGVSRHETGVPGLTTALDPDWDRADALLAHEREESWRYLRSALKSATRAD